LKLKTVYVGITNNNSEKQRKKDNRDSNPQPTGESSKPLPLREGAAATIVLKLTYM
jgi:hypothetical protein